jgi:hypothetical protein
VEEFEKSVALPLVWIGAEDAPILFANQFLAQVQPGEIVLSVGQVTAPAVIGTAEEQQRQLESVGYVPIKVVARYALTPQRLEELAKMLAALVADYKRLHGGATT